MTSTHTGVVESIPAIAICLAGENDPDLETRIRQTNFNLETAGQQCWTDPIAGRQAALSALNQFAETARLLESSGWPSERIKERLARSRRVFATSTFMRRCQEWPRGYPGDFETVEYLAAGVNHSLPGSLGWHIEELLLASPVVQQHRNKLKRQSLEIDGALMKSRSARVLSMACGGGLDWMQVLSELKAFAGEIVLNDSEPAALELAERRLQSATPRYHLAPGNVIRISRRLANCPRFDLVLAGGLFDYLPHRAAVLLLRVITQDLLAPGGVLLFTNIAEGNPWRILMEYGSDWSLIERSEHSLLSMCREAGIPGSSISLQREGTGLTLIARIVQSKFLLAERDDRSQIY